MDAFLQLMFGYLLSTTSILILICLQNEIPVVQERGARLAGVGGGGAGSSAACAGAEMVVSVTYSCGARKEFCFDHFH